MSIQVFWNRCLCFFKIKVYELFIYFGYYFSHLVNWLLKIYIISCHLQKVSFASSFPICIHFVSFAFMTAMARTCNNMSNESGNSEHLWHTPDLRGKAFCFSALSMMSAVDCHIWPLLCWDMFPLKPICWKFSFFYHKQILNFVKIFL